MEFKRLENFYQVDKENYLGFCGYDIFEFDPKEIYLKNILESNILADENTIGDFGPFIINTLTEYDFEKIDFTELNKLLKENYQDENWGKDLEIFKSNVLTIFDHLKIETYEINYINLEKVKTEIKPDPNFWSYFIGIVCINRTENRLIKIYFGGD